MLQILELYGIFVSQFQLSVFSVRNFGCSKIIVIEKVARAAMLSVLSSRPARSDLFAFFFKGLMIRVGHIFHD